MRCSNVLIEGFYHSGCQYGNRHNGGPSKQRLATICAQEFCLFTIPDIELKEEVRQLIICYRVPSIDPLSIHYVAVSKDMPQRSDVMTRPTLKEVELPFARSTGQDMAPALQNQRSVFIEAHSAIRSIQLFLDHDREPLESFARDRVKVFIAWLNS